MAAGLPVNLRTVLDRENIQGLPALSRFAIAKGWTGHPRFKTQLGRNYELHSCQADREKLLSRLQMFEELYALIRRWPEVFIARAGHMWLIGAQLISFIGYLGYIARYFETIAPLVLQSREQD